MKIVTRTKAIENLRKWIGKGNCYDNAVMESFFVALKGEFIDKYRVMNIRELIAGLKKYMYYYNYRRLHSTLGYLSPRDYEKKQLSS